MEGKEKIRPMTIVYVRDMERSISFYEKLGCVVDAKSRSNSWTELKLGEALLALHTSDMLAEPMPRRVELSFVSAVPLKELQVELSALGIQIERPITDEAFGYSMAIRDPDGLVIQINEHDSELYV
jgi:catechol 2,3-dioxygenase-like lactoylglutathione lyase family enzyme